MRKAIKEEDGIQKEWAAEVKDMTMEKLPEFLRKLTEDYEHDYGTICHAIACAAIAAANAVQRSPQGGITGFQAGAIQWEMIKLWGVWGDGPKRITQYEHLLYPQYENDFREISRETWEWVQKEAKKFLKSKEHAHPDVKAHWRSIINEVVPFGLEVAWE